MSANHRLVCTLYIHLASPTNPASRRNGCVALFKNFSKYQSLLLLICATSWAFHSNPSVAAADCRLIYFLCGCPFLKHRPLSPTLSPLLLRLSPTLLFILRDLLSPLCGKHPAPVLREALPFNWLDQAARKKTILHSYCIAALSLLLVTSWEGWSCVCKSHCVTVSLCQHMVRFVMVQNQAKVLWMKSKKSKMSKC